MSELPRLSRSLRATNQLEMSRVILDRHEDRALLQTWRSKQQRKSVSYKELKLFLEKTCDTQSYELILKKLSNLWLLTKELMGTEENAEIIDDAVILLLNLFIDTNIVMMQHLAELKTIFGFVTNNNANKICQIVYELGKILTDDCREYLQVTSKYELDDNNLKPVWGKDIKCTLPSEVNHDFSLLQDLAPTLPTATNTITNFSMLFNDNSTNQLTSAATASSTNTTKKPIKFNRTWLLTNVNADEDVIKILLDRLKSQISNEELQNELFDIVGFDKFELLQEILENRKVIVERVEYDDRRKVLKEKALLTTMKDNQRPHIARQVIVQSEHEKQLMKQMRKDEKKLRNLINDEETNNETEYTDNDLESQELKLRIVEQKRLLANSLKQPVFKERMFPMHLQQQEQKIKYPYVFDSQLEAKSHVGFIAGGKLLLPENVERTDNKIYEEVKIPPTTATIQSINLNENLIKISTLDDIGQSAFAGTVQLNRIQSIVYPIAYHTNQNLLVCAPTGAGKTNVAMLTIIHTIRSFTDQGIIHRDQFKIVYVAPMKALAAEMVENFGKRLSSLGISVRELTGDMQLTKLEMQQTQMLITTPEKWDVVTRKGAGDAGLITLVKLLIIDEVHLLHGERGPVVEALVARTLRLVESSQSMIRIVGLSATLPNYIDVARFLRVNPMIGLFYFDSHFRPVPLEQNFIGVKSFKPLQQLSEMDQICYDKCIEMLRNGYQVMVFVHARNATVRTANILREMAQQKSQLSLFTPIDSTDYGMAQRNMSRSRNKQLVELFQCGLAMHHAGMLRTDRNLVEKYFADGHIKVLVCTATLAWGVNLPAHCVIIKGTEIYDSKHGSFIDIGILDVLQIFGRAGRPQYDKSGIGIIITTHDKLNHYLSLLTNQFPIESNFIQCLADNLNAEITLGTISNVDEAIEWLSYTYLFVRMRINPQVYGINYTDVQGDHTLERKRRDLITTAAMNLDKAQMIRFNQRTGDLNVTDLGRTASHFYIKYDTVEIFNEKLKSVMNESEILAMMANAQEFQQLKVRDEELDELDDLTDQYCEVSVKGGSENLHGKVNILMQTYLSRGFVKSFSLMSDMSYITQNAVRIARALFTIELRRNNPLLAGRLLTMSKMFEKQMWDKFTPLRQFNCISFDVIEKLENRGLSVNTLREMDFREIGDMLRNQKYGKIVWQCAEEFPMLNVEATLHPITRTVLRIRIFIIANFKWNDRVHGKHAESFWIWIEDPETNFIYHSEFFQITRKQTILKEEQELIVTIPLKEPLPPQYYIRIISDTWLGSQSYVPLSFKHLILPELHPPHTELLPLMPLPIYVLNDEKLQSLYSFTHFNPIQTQIFHCLYHTDNNVLLGAPTGSGKTIAAEIAMFRVFKNYPKGKVVYIAPLKALVRERIDDWKIRLEKQLGKSVVELTGDVTPDARKIHESDVIVTTPEKWDGISRSWQTRDYVKNVALIVIDEIHLLGEDRGPVLEVIVSRTNFISSHTDRNLRIIGLSTALANARDLANWLGIEQMGLYNFKPSVRPVPLSVHINGFPGKHYCPRMATMNRPAFQAIRQYSPCTPTLIFVSSRRQTRLTALDLISYLAAEDNPKQFLHIPENEMEQILQGIKETNLKLTLAFGIGLHHAGLHERDRKTCEELFLHRKIQVLIATATLAWGVNLPAHLVIIKGTEYYDGKQKRYVDMPITDILQMMGRAGRPQFGNEGIAVVLVHDAKKNFYKKFLYDPFPVESSLLKVLPDHINAEIVAGTVQTKQSILDYLTWTYCFRRLLRNPTYYELDSIEPNDINRFLTYLVQNVIDTLEDAGCCIYDEMDNRYVQPTSLGKIASYYYLSYQSIKHFSGALTYNMSWEDVLYTMCHAYEFDQLPVRHNEDKYNAELAELCRIKVDHLTYDSPYTKTLLLMQAHFSHHPLPNSDYLTDTKSVLDQAIRVIQAMIDITAERGWLATTLRIQQLMQCIIQARWLDDPPVLTLPHVEYVNVPVFKKINLGYPCLILPALKEKCRANYEVLAGPLRIDFDESQITEIYSVLCEMPTLCVDIKLCGPINNELIDRIVVQPTTRDTWLQVHPEQEYYLNICLTRLGKRTKNVIHCPKFPKDKDESWFLTLGNQYTGELIALKRITYKSNRSSHQLNFVIPKSTIGRVIYTIYLLSDGYIGFDQQYNIQLEIIDGLSEVTSDKYSLKDY